MDDKDSRHASAPTISATQVVAAALGGITSVALASEIGGVGSLIGAAAAAVVSCAAPAVYGPLIERSVDKLRSLHGNAEHGTGSEADTSRHDAGVRDASPHDADTTDIARAGHGGRGGLNPREAAELRVARDAGATSARTAAGTRIAPEGLRHAAAARRHETLRRRMAVAAVVTSLVTVALTAGVISFATGGQGLGDRPGQAVAPASTTQPSTRRAATTRVPTQPASAATAATAAPATGGAADGGVGDGSSSGATGSAGSGEGARETSKDGAGGTGGSASATSAATGTAGTGTAASSAGAGANPPAGAQGSAAKAPAN